MCIEQRTLVSDHARLTPKQNLVSLDTWIIAWWAFRIQTNKLSKD